VQTACNHQVDHDPEFVVKAERYSLAEPADFADRLALNRIERWIEGANEKWTANANAVQGLADYPLLESFDVDRDVGEFGHTVTKGWVLHSGQTLSRPSPESFFRSVLERSAFGRKDHDDGRAKLEWQVHEVPES